MKALLIAFLSWLLLSAVYGLATYIRHASWKRQHREMRHVVGARQWWGQR